MRKITGRRRRGRWGEHIVAGESCRLIEDMHADFFDNVPWVVRRKQVQLLEQGNEVGVDGFLRFGGEDHTAPFLASGMSCDSSFRCSSRLFMRAENLAQIRAISVARWRPPRVRR